MLVRGLQTRRGAVGEPRLGRQAHVRTGGHCLDRSRISAAARRGVAVGVQVEGMGTGRLAEVGSGGQR